MNETKETYVLQLDFEDALGKTFRLSIENPQDDIVLSEVEDCMDTIISAKVFESNGVDLVARSGARIIKTTTNTLEV